VISKEDHKTSHNVRHTDRYIMTTQEICFPMLPAVENKLILLLLKHAIRYDNPLNHNGKFRSLRPQI